MTYNVFGGTLSLTQSILLFGCCAIFFTGPLIFQAAELLTIRCIMAERNLCTLTSPQPSS